MKRLILNLILAAALAAAALLAPAGAVAKVPASFFGITAVNPTDEDFSGIADAGLGVARIEINWRVIQKTRQGGYDWAYVDERLSQVATVGMRPAPLFYGTPRFVSKSPDALVPPTSSAADLREWREFLAAAAQRYGPGGDFWAQNPDLPRAPIHEWLIWNEQNARAFWRPKPDPKAYAKLVKASDRAISAVDPDAEIVLGGIYGYPKDSRSLSAVDFLERLYEVKGIERHFDAVSIHPYGAGVGAVRKQVKQARSVVRKAGDPKVGILIGELGWASAGPKSSEEVVGAKGQAKRLSQGLKLLLRKRQSWNITGAYVYVWRDFASTGGCLWCPRAGLVAADGASKPALKAVRKVIARAR